MMLERGDAIKFLLQKNGGTRYLEIGVEHGLTFNEISVPLKHGVDPRYANGTHMMTSDAFFEQLPAEQLYDVIFIDGLHTHEQVARDLENGLAHLAPRGYIVLHDMMPPDLMHESPQFCGTCWRAIADRRCTDPHFVHVTIDMDYGVGVCRRDTSTTLPLWPDPQVEWTYDYYLQNKEALMNVISPSRFVELFS